MVTICSCSVVVFGDSSSSSSESFSFVSVFFSGLSFCLFAFGVVVFFVVVGCFVGGATFRGYQVSN